jgi:hypothetical protein
VATKHKADEGLHSLCEADLQYQHIAYDLAFCTCDWIVQSVVQLTDQLRCSLRAGDISQRQIGILKSVAQACPTELLYRIRLTRPHLEAHCPEGTAYAVIFVSIA